MKQKIVMPEGDILEMDVPQWKTPYNHNTDLESARYGLYCRDPSRTKQEFKEECDLNVIIARCMKTGEPPPMILSEHFTDVAEKFSYFEMQSRLAEANAHFYTLDADIRSKHLNDPARWADAVVKATEQGDRQGLRDLGLDIPPEPPQTAPAGTTGTASTPVATPQPAPPAGPSGAPTTNTP